MKMMHKILLAAAAVALTACALTACSGSSDSSKADAEASKSDSASSQAETQSSSVDYSAPDVTIAYGDYDGIVALTDDVLAGKYDGKVIKIDGISTKQMSNCAIMESDGNGTKKGMMWKLEGEHEMSDYPAEDAHVEITGVVVIGDYDVRYLQVPESNVTVLE